MKREDVPIDPVLEQIGSEYDTDAYRGLIRMIPIGEVEIDGQAWTVLAAEEEEPGYGYGV